MRSTGDSPRLPAAPDAASEAGLPRMRAEPGRTTRRARSADRRRRSPTVPNDLKTQTSEQLSANGLVTTMSGSTEVKKLCEDALQNRPQLAQESTAPKIAQLAAQGFSNRKFQEEFEALIRQTDHICIPFHQIYDPARLQIVLNALEKSLHLKSLVVQAAGVPHYFRAIVSSLHIIQANCSLRHLSLNVSRNRLGGEDARALGELTSMAYLDVTGNFLGDEGAHQLSKLVSLHTLAISLNGLHSIGAHALAGLGSLAYLNVSCNALDDDGACALAGLGALIYLNVSHNRISSEGLGTLAKLGALTHLDANFQRAC